MIAAGGLPRLTPKTITNPEALKRELALVRAMDYAVSVKENGVGVRAVGALIACHTRRNPKHLTLVGARVSDPCASKVSVSSKGSKLCLDSRLLSAKKTCRAFGHREVRPTLTAKANLRSKAFTSSSKMQQGRLGPTSRPSLAPDLRR